MASSRPAPASEELPPVRMHFIYAAVTENGRRGAKRAPQLVDTRYWSFMFNRVA